MGCDYTIPLLITKGVNFKEEKAKNYFQAYLSIKDMINWIKKTKKGTTEAYLISKQSIPNFVNILFNPNSNILNKIYWKNDLLELAENEFMKSLFEYKLDKNIIFLSTYQECLKYKVENEDKENEFIIVDDKFIKPMELDYEDVVHKKVELLIDNNLKIFQIKFPNNVKKINFKEKKRGIYKFISKNEIDDINIKSHNYNYNIGSSSLFVSQFTSIQKNVSDNLTLKIFDQTESKNLTEYFKNPNKCVYLSPNNNH